MSTADCEKNPTVLFIFNKHILSYVRFPIVRERYVANVEIRNITKNSRKSIIFFWNYRRPCYSTCRLFYFFTKNKLYRKYLSVRYLYFGQSFSSRTRRMFRFRCRSKAVFFELRTSNRIVPFAYFSFLPNSFWIRTAWRKIIRAPPAEKIISIWDARFVLYTSAVIEVPALMWTRFLCFSRA